MRSIVMNSKLNEQRCTAKENVEAEYKVHMVLNDHEYVGAEQYEFYYLVDEMVLLK